MAAAEAEKEKKINQLLRDIQRRPENKKCADCTERLPQYVVMDFGTFVCTTCSGIHREFSHRIKSVSLMKWTMEEAKSMRAAGNAVSNTLFMARYDPNRHPPEPDSSDAEKRREFIRMKYVDRRWYGTPEDLAKEAERKEQLKHQKKHDRKDSAAAASSNTGYQGNSSVRRPSGTASAVPTHHHTQTAAASMGAHTHQGPPVPPKPSSGGGIDFLDLLSAPAAAGTSSGANSGTLSGAPASAVLHPAFSSFVPPPAPVSQRVVPGWGGYGIQQQPQQSQIPANASMQSSMQASNGSVNNAPMPATTPQGAQQNTQGAQQSGWAAFSSPQMNAQQQPSSNSQIPSIHSNIQNMQGQPNQNQPSTDMFSSMYQQKQPPPQQMSQQAVQNPFQSPGMGIGGGMMQQPQPSPMQMQQNYSNMQQQAGARPQGMVGMQGGAFTSQPYFMPPVAYPSPLQPSMLHQQPGSQFFPQQQGGLHQQHSNNIQNQSGGAAFGNYLADPFENLSVSGGQGNASSSGSHSNGAAPLRTYVSGERVMYLKNGQPPMSAMILKAHPDDPHPPYYTIRVDGDSAERQTDHTHLQPLEGGGVGHASTSSSSQTPGGSKVNKSMEPSPFSFMDPLESMKRAAFGIPAAGRKPSNGSSNTQAPNPFADGHADPPASQSGGAPANPFDF